MNTSIFKSGTPGRAATPADTKNEAGGKAYSQSNEAALALLAATGTFADQFYSTADQQLELFKKLAAPCMSEYIAKCAIFARQRGFMKDMPVALLAFLAGRSASLPNPGANVAGAVLELAFPHVVDNGKQLRNFVQMVRSGAFGRKSLGSLPRRLVSSWLLDHPVDFVFRGSLGGKGDDGMPMSDVLRLVRPKPDNAERSALFAYLLGKKTPEVAMHLPALIRDLELWRAGEPIDPPRVPWEMLTSSPLTAVQWKALAKGTSWQQLRQNLANFGRHGAWDDPKMVEWAAAKLRNADEIRRARVFPFQLLAAFKFAEGIPGELRLALQDAMDVACENVPTFEGVVHVYPDVSGSMSSCVTGTQPGKPPSKISCIEAAAVVCAAIMRNNPNALVIPFDTRPHAKHDLNPRDSIMTNAARLARFAGGGTDCSQPLRHVLEHEKKRLPDVAIYLSDNESWIDTQGSYYAARFAVRYTGVQELWNQVLAKKPNAKLICVNMASYPTVQAKGEGVLNIGGFSDVVFETMASFAKGDYTADGKMATDWVAAVNAIQLVETPPMR